MLSQAMSFNTGLSLDIHDLAVLDDGNNNVHAAEGADAHANDYVNVNVNGNGNVVNEPVDFEDDDVVAHVVHVLADLEEEHAQA